MRVLLVTHEASLSGAPRVAQLSARALARAGHEVVVRSRRPGPALPGFAAVAPTRVEGWWRLRRRLWDVPIPGLALIVDTLGVLATLLRVRPDLVYVNSVSAAVYLRPARWCRLPVVLHVHESAAVAAEFWSRAAMPGPPEGVRLLACSPSVRADLAAACPGRPISLLPSVPDQDAVLAGARASCPDRWPGAIVVGACGRIEERKGADLWLAAARRLLADLPGVPLRFVWVGDGTPPGPIAPGEPIEFLGPLSAPYPVLARFDLATLPSRDDPFPLVVLESMTLGTPVVAFAVGGVAEQVADTGVLVSPGDMDGFTAAVRALVLDPDRRRRLGAAAAIRAAELFSSQAYARRLVAVLEEISGLAEDRVADPVQEAAR